VLSTHVVTLLSTIFNLCLCFLAIRRSSLNACNHYLERAFLCPFHRLKCLVGIIKCESMRNQSRRLHSATGNQLYSLLIAPRRVPNGPFNGEPPGARRGDGEDDVFLAHARLHKGPALLRSKNTRLDTGFCAGALEHHICTFSELELGNDVVGSDLACSTGSASLPLD